MINIHSLSFKFLGLVLGTTLLFMTVVSYLTTHLVIEQYKHIEQEKLQGIINTIRPTLSLAISYDFSKSIEEMADELMQTEQMLHVTITRDKLPTITRSKASYNSDKPGGFSHKSTLHDPITNTPIGSIKAIYSSAVFDAKMATYYEHLALTIALFLLFLTFVSYLLYKMAQPLKKLADEMSTFDPQSPKQPNLELNSKDEVGLISRAAEAMIRSMISYLQQLESLKTALLQRESHLNEAQCIAHVGSWEYRMQEKQFSMSQEMYRILGTNLNKQHYHWEDFLEHIVVEDRELFEVTLSQAIENGSTFKIRYKCRKTSGGYVHINTQGKVRKKSGLTRIAGVSMDITEQKRSQEIIEKLAYYDVLTGLPNRALFKDRLEKAIASAKRHQRNVTVFFVDLDHFKLINDSLGHMVGDELLKKVSGILVENLREEDTVCRLGGDEFTILIAGAQSRETIATIAKKLVESINVSMSIGKHELYISMSMGIALYPEHGINADEMIKNADTALYRAKELGRNNFQFYQTQMGSHLDHQLDLEQEFRQAVKSKRELRLYYQPKIDLHSGNITGAEALIRWEHPKKGLLFPDSFIPLAESTGLIVELGNWILEEGMAQVARWSEKYPTPLHLAINLSARQFQDEQLIETTRMLLERYKVDPKLIEFEITESISMSNIVENLQIMKQLKRLGVAIAIDDFGTGYSSLSYLKRFPVDTLKIDKSFVIDMLEDRDDYVIASTIVSMAQSLGFKTVAEGVESEIHATMLQRIGCSYAQGFHYAKALNIEAFEDYVTSFSADAP